jgi:hypothetical protein
VGIGGQHMRMPRGAHLVRLSCRVQAACRARATDDCVVVTSERAATRPTAGPQVHVTMHIDRACTCAMGSSRLALGLAQLF